MKRFMILIATAGLLLLPITGFSDFIYTTAAADQNTTAVNPPPVAQPLVREGNFAVKLAEAFNIGTPQNEAAAESMLASIGIAPNNGWISDFPVTPEVIAQLQNSIRSAVNSGSLAMDTAGAMAALQSVSDNFGLKIVVAGTGTSQSAGSPTPPSSGYTSPSVVNNYYYDYGPPVVTYYTPPPAYLYMYAWVPSPFWCGSDYFAGFFMLNDFDTVVYVHHRREVCTNHLYNPRTGLALIINPVDGRYYRSVARFPHFNRFEAEKGGKAIHHRAWGAGRYHAYGTAPNEFRGRNPRPPGFGERFRGPANYNSGRPGQSMNQGRQEGQFFNFRNNSTDHALQYNRPPSSSERSYRSPRSLESHDRIQDFGYRDHLGGLHDRNFAGIHGSGSGHEGVGRGFHGRQFSGTHDVGGGHEGLSRGFNHSGDFGRG